MDVEVKARIRRFKTGQTFQPSRRGEIPAVVIEKLASVKSHIGGAVEGDFLFKGADARADPGTEGIVIESAEGARLFSPIPLTLMKMPNLSSSSPAVSPTNAGDRAVIVPCA